MADANLTPIDAPAQGPHGHKNPLYLGRYQSGCRCAACVAVFRLYHQTRRANRPGASAKAQREYRDRQSLIDPKFSTKWYREKAKAPAFRAAHVQKARERIGERRAMLAEIKLSRGCADCGYRQHSAALDFDHVRGEKFTEVSVMGTLSLNRIMAEVAKCDVVCYRCHRVRTRARLTAGESAWVRKRVPNPSPDTLKMARYRARGWAFLSEVKLSRGCADCGYKERPEALDFDHVRGVKSFDISQRPQYAIATLTAEIAKCECVCANCHRVRTYTRSQASRARELTRRQVPRARRILRLRPARHAARYTHMSAHDKKPEAAKVADDKKAPDKVESPVAKPAKAEKPSECEAALALVAALAADLNAKKDAGKPLHEACAKADAESAAAECKLRAAEEELLKVARAKSVV